MEGEADIDRKILSGIDLIHVSLIFRGISSVVLIVTGETLFSFLVISDSYYNPVFAYAALIGLIIGIIGLSYMRRGMEEFTSADKELKIGYSGVNNEIAGLALMIAAIIMAFIGHSYPFRIVFTSGSVTFLITHVVLFIVGVVLAIVGVSLIFVSFFRLGLARKDDVLVVTSIVFVISTAIGYAIMGASFNTEILALSVTGVFALYYGLYSFKNRLRAEYQKPHIH